MYRNDKLELGISVGNVNIQLQYYVVITRDYTLLRKYNTLAQLVLKNIISVNFFDER